MSSDRTENCTNPTLNEKNCQNAIDHGQTYKKYRGRAREGV